MENEIKQKDSEFILSRNLPWNHLDGKTILISGANGFIPSYIIETLLYFNAKKHGNIRIIGIVRDRKRARKRFAAVMNKTNLKLLFQDVSEPIKLTEKIHYIIHAASQASPKYYSTDPVGTLKANILGTYNLLELSRKNPVKSFLFISAGEIYGNISTIGKTTETMYGPLDPTDVRSCYAESKRAGETMCASWVHQYGVPAKIVRLYHTYGPGISLDDGRVFSDFVSNIINNENLLMKSDGTAVRSFTYIADVVSACFTVLFQGKNAVAYNVANEKATLSIRQLTKVLVKLFSEKKLKVIFKKRSKKDAYMVSPIKTNYPSTARIKKLGWRPNYSLSDGFLRTIEYYSHLT